MEDDSTVVEVKNLTKTFGKAVIVDGANLSIKKGEVLGIIGVSGSGKTTLMKTIVGFLIPDAGYIAFRSNDELKSVHRYSGDAKRFFGFAAQEPSFYLELKVGENLDHFGALYGMSRKQRKKNIDLLLKQFDLENTRDMLAVKLSGGMRKRVGLLTSTIHNPEVFVLDEPTADLDPASRKKVMEFIRNAKESGKTVIIASHLIEDLEQLCDRIAVMHKKRVIKVASPAELMSLHSKNKHIEIQTNPANYDLIVEKLSQRKDKLNIDEMKIVGKKLNIRTRDAETVLALLLNFIKMSQLELTDISITKTSLHDLFEYIVKGKVELKQDPKPEAKPEVKQEVNEKEEQ